MISKISFIKMAKDEWRKLSWLMALQAVVFCLLIPFRMLMALVMRSSGQDPLTEAEKLELFCHNMGLGCWVNVPVILICGAVCALCVFEYLHSPRKLDLYHSLPVKREQLFGAKYLGSVMTFVLPYVFAQLLGVLVCVPYGAVDLAGAMEVGIATVMGILFFLCSYSGTLLALLLTGKMLTTVCALAVLIGYIPMLLIILDTFRNLFWYTSMNSASMTDIFVWSSPWAVCLLWGRGKGQAGGTGITGQYPTLGGVCQLIAIAALLSLVSCALCRARKTEAAGRALAFPKLEGVVKVLLSVLAALVAAIVAYAGAEGNVLLELVFIVLFGALGCTIMEFIYRWDIRQALMHRWHIALTAGIAAAIFFAARYDLIGYNTYLPKEEEIASMAVAEKYSSIPRVDGGSLYYSATREVLDGLETDNVAALYPAAENGVANVRRSYGETDGSGPTTAVKFTLKSGKEIYRVYSVDEEVLYGSLKEVQQDPQVQERYYPILAAKAEDFSEISMSVWPGEFDYVFEGKSTAGTEEDGSPSDEDEAAEEEADLGDEDPGAEAGTGLGDEDPGAEAGTGLGDEDSGAEVETGFGDEASAAEVETDFSDEEYATERWEGNDCYTVAVPANRKQEVLEAYQRDLRRLVPEKLQESSGGANLTFYLNDSEDMSFVAYFYPLSYQFSETREILWELLTEQYPDLEYPFPPGTLG